MSEASRLSGVFFEPKRAFADIAARPRFWVPLMLVALMTTVFMVSFSRRVGWERVMIQQMENSPRAQQMSADQRQAALEAQRRFAPVMGTVMQFVAPVMAGLAILIVATVLLLFVKMMGADVSFRQSFAITSYGHLPNVIASAAATAVVWLKDPDQFNLENPTAFNLGAFLDPQSTPKWQMALATSLDVFVIWVILLLATGFAAAQPKKLTFGKALTAVLIPWLLWVVGKTGLAALRG